jgi:hypothetical protein
MMRLNFDPSLPCPKTPPLIILSSLPCPKTPPLIDLSSLPCAKTPKLDIVLPSSWKNEKHITHFRNVMAAASSERGVAGGFANFLYILIAGLS